MPPRSSQGQARLVVGRTAPAAERFRRPRRLRGRSPELPHGPILGRRLDRRDLDHRPHRPAAARHRLHADDHRPVGAGDLRLDQEQGHRRLPRQLDARTGGGSGTLRCRRLGGRRSPESRGRQVHPGGTCLYAGAGPQGLQRHPSIRGPAEQLHLRHRARQRRQPAGAQDDQGQPVRSRRFQAGGIERARGARTGRARRPEQGAHRLSGMGTAPHEHALRPQVSEPEATPCSARTSAARPSTR